MKWIELTSVAPLVLALAIAGCDKDRESAPPPVEPPPPPTVTESVLAPAPLSEEVDLIGDKPEAKSTEKQKAILLDDMEPSGPLSLNARKCYNLIASTKDKIEKISADLDDGGKQITRLIRTSDDLSKDITELAEIWAYDKAFRDVCINAKRNTLVLNDELSRSPRKWTHVRWAFTNTLKSISVLRLRAREVAELEPKPLAVVGKDGKVVYVEAPPPEIDPAIAKREEIVKKTERMRAQMREIEKEKKKESLPTDLDSKK